MSKFAVFHSHIHNFYISDWYSTGDVTTEVSTTDVSPPGNLGQYLKEPGPIA